MYGLTEGERFVPLAWVPYAGRADAERRLGHIPAGLELDFYRADGDELPRTIGEVAFYVLPYMKGTAVLDKVSEMPRLEVVQTLTAGYEDVLPLLPDEVTLCNAAGLHDTSTAELAVALALASGRQLGLFARNQLSGTWDQRPGRSLADQRVLIVGYGHIGAAIEARLLAFEVASVTRVSRRGRTGPPPVHPFDDLPALLPAADVVFVAAPHTPETEGLFGARNLGLLPDGALLVNVARGKLVDTAALLAELSSGRITAALDVTSPEPPPPGHPLWHAPGVLISPHVGGASSAFAPRAGRLIAAQLARFAAGEPLANIVRPGRSRPES
jgi:phosphoglycerate dehydrogenase-like enzyme